MDRSNQPLSIAYRFKTEGYIKITNDKRSADEPNLFEIMMSAQSAIIRPDASFLPEVRSQISNTANQFTKKKTLNQLSHSINKIEDRQPLLSKPEKDLRISLKIKEIDTALDTASGRGIIANGLHEVRVETGLAAANGAGFCLCLGLTITRALFGAENMLPIFWISDHYNQTEYGNFYGPGLNPFGIKSENLIRIHPNNLDDGLWAAGEIAATKNAASFCIIEINHHPKKIDLTTTRQLLLRAQSSNTFIILLRQSGQEEASAALTRWHIKPIQSSPVSNFHKTTKNSHPLQGQFIGPPAFSVCLEKCRGGNPNQTNPWKVEWNNNDQCLTRINKKHSASSASIATPHRTFRTTNAIKRAS